MRFLAALALAAGLLFVTPPAHATDSVTLHQAVETFAARKMNVAVVAHSVGSGQIIVDRIDMQCVVGCGAVTYTFTNIYIRLKGSAGAILWSKDNVTLTGTQTLSFWPNRTTGKTSYWQISSMFINPEHYVAGDCWQAWEGSQGYAPHPGCVYSSPA